MKPIAFFDVDRTLIKGYSGFYTTLVLIQKGILKKRRLPEALFYRLVGPILTSVRSSSDRRAAGSGDQGDQTILKRMYQIAINDMAGTSLEEILKIGRACFERWIRPRIYREAVEKIEWHKKRGEPVYLITSGPYMTTRIMAEFLGVDGEYSVGPVVNDAGILTSQIGLPVYYREGKVTAAEALIRKHGVSLRECYFYSDSIDDLFLMEKVGHPHLVNPDRRLRKIGVERRWPILRFSRVLG